MKVMTVFGTRPEIIRLSRIMTNLDQVCDHVMVHTGQNYDRNLSDIFLDELGIRNPDYYIESKSSTPIEQISKILTGVEQIMLKEQPERLLLLGDTNSALSAYVAKRLGISVFHMEAGNRCFDDRVPEEINRRVIDHSSDILLPYTERSRENLLKEGVGGNRVFVTGNPIYEVLHYYRDSIDASRIHDQLNVKRNQYFLVTMHRAENVDVQERVNGFVEAFRVIHDTYGLPIICIVHPRLSSQLNRSGNSLDVEGVITIDPLGLFDFVQLEKHAFCVLSDSGTVQEECAIFQVPNVTIRDVTERPETLESGSNYLAGCDVQSILRGIRLATEFRSINEPPAGYMAPNVSGIVTKIIMSYWR
jgi:UDP-N-acetylglucosamine 2-epimerase (non-hydrolysing)